MLRVLMFVIIQAHEISPLSCTELVDYSACALVPKHLHPYLDYLELSSS